MANEFKIKTGLLINNTHPVTGITDSSTFYSTDTSTLATVKAIKEYVDSHLPDLGNQGQLPYMNDESNNFSYGNIYFNYNNRTLHINSDGHQSASLVLDASAGAFAGQAYYNSETNSFQLSSTGELYLSPLKNLRLGGYTRSYVDYVYFDNPSDGYNPFHIKAYNHDSILKLEDSGRFYCPSLGSGSQSKTLYFNTTSGEITYGDPCIGGGVGDVTKLYVDGSLVTRDSSITYLMINDSNQDVSLNEIWAKLDACIGSSSVNFGKNHQIPFMNDTSTNFEYLDRLRLSEETKDLIFSGAGLATVKIFGHESVDLNHFLEIHQDANNEISYINSTNSTLWLLADKSVAIGGFPTSGGGYPPDNSSTFLNVVCPSTYYDDILRVSPYGGFDTNSFLVVSADGSIKFPHIPEQSTSKVLYYDTVTKSISYSDVSDGGGTFNLWDVSTDNTTVFLRDPCDNLQLSYIEFHPDGGKLLFADMPIVNAETSMEQSYTMRIDGSSALKIYGVGANTALSETAVVVEANYFSLGDPKTDGSWRFVIDSSGNLSVQKRVSNSWVEKGNFN